MHVQLLMNYLVLKLIIQIIKNEKIRLLFSLLLNKKVSERKTKNFINYRILLRECAHLQYNVHLYCRFSPHRFYVSSLTSEIYQLRLGHRPQGDTHADLFSN